MWQYLIRRLILLPITLFFIVLINFGIINLAPGDPVSQLDVTNQGAAKSQSGNAATGMEDRYLQFREFFGLTLPVLWNNWPQTAKTEILSMLTAISNYLKPGGKKEIPAKEFHDIRLKMGDMARFVMPKLLQIIPRRHQNGLSWAQAHTRRKTVQRKDRRRQLFFQRQCALRIR